MSSMTCARATVCPGCPALGQADELAVKVERVHRAFAHHGLSIESSPLWSPEVRAGYRTRAKWVCDASGAIGLYRRGGHDVVDLPSCPVVRPIVAEVLALVRVARTAELAWLAPSRWLGLDVRETVGDGLGVLVTITTPASEPLTAQELDRIEATLRDRLPDVQVSASGATKDTSPRTLGTYRLDGARVLLDRIGEGPPFLASHGSFVQAHRDTAAAIHDRIAARIGRLEVGSPRVIELYAGSAALSLRLAALGCHVTAVERFAPALALAASSATRLGVELHTYEGDAAEVDLGRFGVTDAIVVNPPRRGLAPRVRMAIARGMPKVLAYVACDPETLARDAGHFTRLGLGVASVQPFDMMPQTYEVETLAFFEPRPIPPPTIVAEGPTWWLIAKDAHEPTTPHPEFTTSALARVRGLAGGERATPVHRLDQGTSGLCLFAKAPEHVAPLAVALSQAEKTYLALVRGIPRPKGIVRRPLRDEGRMLSAVTRYRCKRLVAGHGLVEARPAEGRLHQVRRHLAELGHPIVGDARYGHPPTNRRFEELHSLDRPFLHCKRMAIRLDGVDRTFEAPLPADLTSTLARLGG